MAEAGRALCVLLPNPCLSRDMQSRVPRDTVRRLLEISSISMFILESFVYIKNRRKIEKGLGFLRASV